MYYRNEIRIKEWSFKEIPLGLKKTMNFWNYAFLKLQQHILKQHEYLLSEDLLVFTNQVNILKILWYSCLLDNYATLWDSKSRSMIQNFQNASRSNTYLPGVFLFRPSLRFLLIAFYMIGYKPFSPSLWSERCLSLHKLRGHLFGWQNYLIYTTGESCMSQARKKLKSKLKAEVKKQENSLN